MDFILQIYVCNINVCKCLLTAFASSKIVDTIWYKKFVKFDFFCCRIFRLLRLAIAKCELRACVFVSVFAILADVGRTIKIKRHFDDWELRIEGAAGVKVQDKCMYRRYRWYPLHPSLCLFLLLLHWMLHHFSANPKFHQSLQTTCAGKMDG